MALKQRHAVWQPVKMSEYWSDVNMWKCTDYKTGCTVLGFLKFADQALRETSQERDAKVNACEYERDKSFGGIISEVVANSTNTSDFQESSFADEIVVFFHREILV